MMIAELLASKYGKPIVVFLVLVSSLGTLYALYQSRISDAFDEGYRTAENDIREKHALLIQEQIDKHTKDVETKVAEYNQKLKQREIETAKYWQEQLQRVKADVVAEEKTKNEIEGIIDDFENISTTCDVIGDDALRLYNKTRRVISPPADFRNRIAANSRQKSANF